MAWIISSAYAHAFGNPNLHPWFTKAPLPFEVQCGFLGWMTLERGKRNHQTMARHFGISMWPEKTSIILRFILKNFQILVSFFSHWWMRPFTTSTETPTIPFNTDLCRDALVHSRPHWEGKGLEVPMKGALGRNSFNMLGTSSTSMLPGKAIRCPSCLLISAVLTRTNILGLLHCEWKYFTLHELSGAYRVCLYVPFSTHRSMLSMLAWNGSKKSSS